MKNKFCQNLTCPICKEKRVYFFALKNKIKLYRCSSCGFIFVWPLLKEYLGIYEEECFSGKNNDTGYADYEGDREIMIQNFKAYLERINKISKGSGRLLDVGSATGHFMEIAKKQGWNVFGMEISDYAAGIGRRKGLEIKTGNFEDFDYPNASFDVVTFLDILEHFMNPELAIGKAARILKSGGILVINTPNTDSLLAKVFGKNWHLIAPPGHLSYFNRSNLEKILEKNGLKVVFCGNIVKRFSLRAIVKALAYWQKMFIWKKFFDYLSDKRVGRIGIPLRTGDNMFVIAKKI
jgi:2-polyprenyl-3-methyl-5-hydroxy-6-metoxy-1,4-benzoquinol methylase